MGDLAFNTGKKVLGDKMKSEIKDIMIKQVMSDAIGESANQTFKTALGWTTLFITFIDTYSKAVAEASLDRVRKYYEVCPHIGQCQNFGHAITIANKTTSTLWFVEGFYYFHPQMNYMVSRSSQILRSTSEGGWKIEDPRRPEFQTEDCWACSEAHSGKYKPIRNF